MNNVILLSVILLIFDVLNFTLSNVILLHVVTQDVILLKFILKMSFGSRAFGWMTKRHLTSPNYAVIQQKFSPHMKEKEMVVFLLFSFHRHLIYIDRAWAIFLVLICRSWAVMEGDFLKLSCPVNLSFHPVPFHPIPFICSWMGISLMLDIDWFMGRSTNLVVNVSYVSGRHK